MQWEHQSGRNACLPSNLQGTATFSGWSAFSLEWYPSRVGVSFDPTGDASVASSILSTFLRDLGIRYEDPVKIRQ